MFEVNFTRFGARPPFEEVKYFVDPHRPRYGAEPICKFLQTAPSMGRKVLRVAGIFRDEVIFHGYLLILFSCLLKTMN